MTPEFLDSVRPALAGIRSRGQLRFIKRRLDRYYRDQLLAASSTHNDIAAIEAMPTG